MVMAPWELGYFTPNKFRTQNELRRLLARIWDGEQPRRRIPGLRFDNVDRSHYIPEEHCIVIAPHQQCYDVLIHEATHAIGFHDHGPKFIKKHIGLLARYARCDELKLLMYASLLGYRL
jgi:hypothetical protein